MTDNKNSVSVALVAIAGITLWGGTAVANKLAVLHMDALTVGVLRSMLAGCLATVIAIVARLPRPRSRHELVLLLVSGISSFALWPMTLSFGLGWTSANHAALIMALLPVITGLMGAAVSRSFPGLSWWLGSIIAITGAVVLISMQNSSGSSVSQSSIAGDLVILAGCFVCAIGYVAGAKVTASIGTWATTFWGLAAALIVLVPVFAMIADRTDWGAVDPTAWASIAYLTLCSSLLGYAAWFWALGRGGVTQVAPWQLLQPLLTFAFAAWFLSEMVTAPLILSAIAILLGTAITQRRGPSRQKN